MALAARSSSARLPQQHRIRADTREVGRTYIQSRLENGEGTTLEVTLRVMRVLGLMDAVVGATDPFTTERGRLMLGEKLPERVRVRSDD